MRRSLLVRLTAFVSVAAIVITVSRKPRADSGTCSGVNVMLPFTDVAGNFFFCQIAAAYFSGLANGTTPTTYSPYANVTRDQMAAFATRTMDESVNRASRRAALEQLWTTQGTPNLALTTVGAFPVQVKSDGADLWVASYNSATVSRVRGSDGRLLETWNGATAAANVLIAMGKVFVVGNTNPGTLFQIDPTQPQGMVTTVTNSLGGSSAGIVFDGQRIFIANSGIGTGTTGSVSILTLNPLTINTVSSGFNRPSGEIYDGTSVWVADDGDNTLKKLDSTGNVISTVAVGFTPGVPGFDGTNIWVPNLNFGNISIVRAKGVLAGTVIATLSGNGMNGPNQAAFDGERIIVTNHGGDSVSLWKASDFSVIGVFPLGAGSAPSGVCSDGLNFWIVLGGPGKLARF